MAEALADLAAAVAAAEQALLAYDAGAEFGQSPVIDQSIVTRLAAVAHRAAAHRCLPLLSLPPELVVKTAEQLLSSDVRGLLRLHQCSRQLCDMLQGLRATAAARRFRWDASNEQALHGIVSDDEMAWTSCTDWSSAIGSLLPRSGHVCWRIRVDAKRGINDRLNVGICDACCSEAWMVWSGEGELYRFVWADKYGDGVDWTCSRDLDPEAHTESHNEGYPDGDATQIVGDYESFEDSVGTIYTFTYDADAGELTMQIDGGDEIPMLSGFPPGVAMRPMVISNERGTTVTIDGCP